MKFTRATMRDGYVRKRKMFLFFPKTINFETRWLEIAEWKEMLRVHPFPVFLGKNSFWTPIEWTN